MIACVFGMVRVLLSQRIQNKIPKQDRSKQKTQMTQEKHKQYNDKQKIQIKVQKTLLYLIIQLLFLMRFFVLSKFKHAHASQTANSIRVTLIYVCKKKHRRCI